MQRPQEVRIEREWLPAKNHGYSPGGGLAAFRSAGISNPHLLRTGGQAPNRTGFPREDRNVPPIRQDSAPNPTGICPQEDRIRCNS